MPTIFLGGGAALLKRHLPASAGLCRPFILDDVSLNAKGFERLCGQMSSREKNG
jgi:plasmid segregation protein ParM